MEPIEGRVSVATGGDMLVYLFLVRLDCEGDRGKSMILSLALSRKIKL